MVDLTLGLEEPRTGVPRVGQWIARALLERYVYLDPPQHVVDELALLLRSGGWELAPVLRTLFLSEAFFSAKAREGIVKGPADHVLGFVRATGLLGSPAAIDHQLQLMGHRPTQPPSVDGWPGGTQWLSAQGMIDRANTVNYLTEQAQALQAGLGIAALDLLPTPDAGSAATVDALAARLRVVLSAAERDTLVAYLDTTRDDRGLVTDDPFDPAGNPAGAEDRVRGLLWILAQHPTAQTR
jgi:hypothetical protein